MPNPEVKALCDVRVPFLFEFYLKAFTSFKRANILEPVCSNILT